MSSQLRQLASCTRLLHDKPWIIYRDEMHMDMQKTTFSVFAVLIAVAVCIQFYSAHRSNHLVAGNGKNGPANMVWIPTQTFLMGSNSPLAKPNEKPAHLVKINGFWIDKYDVTNAEFAEFVNATGYLTTAERKPDWKTLEVQLPSGTPRPPESKLLPGAMVFVGTKTAVPLDNSSRWWRYVPGTSWRHPEGPNSTIVGKDNFPVVQVSYQDALAYAKWVGKRLPTEAEWELAARGGLKQADYAWGDEFKPHNQRMANTFIGKQFPVVDPAYQNKIRPTKVGSYPPNGYGLYDMAGNVWQWVADWYREDAFLQAANNQKIIYNPQGPTDSFDPNDTYAPPNAPKHVIRGGSFLCDENFCTSYRTSARRGVDPYNPMEHIGFRLAKSK